MDKNYVTVKSIVKINKRLFEMQFSIRWKLITDQCDSHCPNSGDIAEVKGKRVSANP